MIIYTVKPNDTLFSIAAAYNVTAAYLAETNGIPEDVPLVVGQTLIIPSDNLSIIGTLAVNGYCYPSITPELLATALPHLTYISIFNYGFTLEGSLIEADDAEIISTALEYGVAPVMVLTTITETGNFNSNLASALFRDPDIQDILISNLINTLIQKKYYALDIDFEFIPPEDEDLFISFLERLKTALEENDLKLFVSLAPKTSVDQKGILYEAHNYKRVGEIADLSLLMTYEWGYTYGPPLPVAPINEVAKVINFAASEIPPEDCTMGVPNYGYDWKLPYTRGETKARSIGNPEAVDIARENGAEILYDDEAQAPYFYYTDDENNQHIVWFEDARSIYSKLTFAYESDLFGVGIWNIMRDFPQMWLIISENFDVLKISL